MTHITKWLRNILCLVLFSVVLVVPSTAQAAATSLKLDGHGWGHGRGMGQYGALGYAVNSSWSYTQILDHYYSNTTMGSVANTPINVRLLEAGEGSTLIATATNAFSVAGTSVAGGKAVQVARIGSNQFRIYTANNCGGGGNWIPLKDATGPVIINPPTFSPGNNIANMLQRCTASDTRAYRGHLRAYDDNGTLRAVNRLDLEDYLRGVVPRESPASWGTKGGGKGMNALRAQAVAARSYAMSENRYSYAKTCDSNVCQVYRGASVIGTSQKEETTTDSAVSDTAGQVRMLSGSVARTEFSSSTGGYTAGGTFPAVVDAGDDNVDNPNHNWSVTISAATMQSKYPSIGTYTGVTINSRNGLGDWGGRVTSITIRGSGGNTTVTGSSFRSTLGLKSDWFKVAGEPSGGTGGYWIGAGTDGGVFTFGNAPFYGSLGSTPLNKPVVGMEATPDDGGYWFVASDGGVFSFGNAKFKGSTGSIALNKPIVGMASTPSGNGYWLVASDGGIFSFGDAPFKGSTGSITLNKPIVGMASTPSGNGYWLVASDGGIFAFGDAQFKGSTGSIKLVRPIVSMAATTTGQGYWMMASDGGIFAFGNAPFAGSGASSGLEFVDFEPAKDGQGYDLLAANGSVLAYGTAPDFGGISDAVPGYRGRAMAILGTAD